VGDGVHPPLKTSTQNEAEKVIGNDAGKYQASLASHVASMRSAQQRLAEMRDLSKGFQPGATAEWRNKAGAYVKDVGTSLGLSPEQADSMASAIAKGDISKAQAFQKLAAQGAMESLKSAMATDNGTQAGRTTQAEFQLFAKNSPNIELDPASLDRMMNFVTRQYQMGSAELQGFTKYYKTGKDLQAWPSIWDEQAKSLGYVSPSVTSGTAKGSAGSATHQRVGVSKSGRAIIETSPGVWEYSDTKKQER
jgi:hypothetical protein